MPKAPDSPELQGDRECRTCSHTKPAKDFRMYSKVSSTGKHYYRQTRCRECESLYSKTQGRVNSLQRQYNMTPGEYLDLLQEQNNRCAICEEECSTGWRLAVDHDHDTGEVRGLLCNKCNRGLGYFKDNTQLLSAAILYLRGVRGND